MKLFMMIPLYHIQIKLMSNYFMYASPRAKLTAYSEYLDDYNVNISIESVCKVFIKLSQMVL